MPTHRISRTALSLMGLTFHEGRAPDMPLIAALRQEGYRRVVQDMGLDVFDARAVQFVCRSDTDGQVVGCLRGLSRSSGPLELEAYMPGFTRWASATPECRPMELTRFVVPRSARSVAIKAGLWKVVWMYAARTGHSHLVVAVRPGAVRDYVPIGFVALESCPPFPYGSLGGRTHHAMVLDLHRAPERLRERDPFWHEFFCATDHPQIVFT